MGALIRISGRVFGRLTVVKRVGSMGSQAFWLCACSCGKSLGVRSRDLRKGITRSCGCLAHDVHHAWFLTHGLSHTPEYEVWQKMRTRCLNPKSTHYEHYGGRGIRVCKRWSRFSNFIKDMGTRPTAKHQIDRINTNGDYKPSNCRWVTVREQMNNTRRNCHMTLRGETLTCAQWARRLNIEQHTLRHRVLRLGWSDEEALTRPVQRCGRLSQ